MGQFEQEKFNQFVLNNGVIGFFEEAIKIKSGRMTNWYVNWRNVAEDTFLIDQLSDYVLAFCEELKQSGKLSVEPQCFYGVPEGASKLGILCQYKFAKASANFAAGSHVLAMGRGKPKEHGVPKDKFFVGAPKGQTILLEDVTTTGGSLITTIEQLKDAEIPICAAIGLTNRMELRDDRSSVKEAVEALGVPYFYMSSAIELLPKAYAELNPGEAVAKSIEKEFEEHGMLALKLL